MTDLTGATLALAVAKVIGADIDGLMILGPGAWTDREHPDPSGEGVFVLRESWRPDQGGAAAWEVLEWVLGQRLHVEMWRDRLDGRTVCWILDRPRNGRLVADGIGPADGPTDAIALCRAVVALGEAL